MMSGSRKNRYKNEASKRSSRAQQSEAHSKCSVTREAAPGTKRGLKSSPCGAHCAHALKHFHWLPFGLQARMTRALAAETQYRSQITDHRAKTRRCVLSVWLSDSAESDRAGSSSGAYGVGCFASPSLGFLISNMEIIIDLGGEGSGD